MTTSSPSAPSAPGAILGALSTPLLLVAWWCLAVDDRPVWRLVVGITAGALGLAIIVLAVLAIWNAPPPPDEPTAKP